MPSYFNLNVFAWRQLRRSWALTPTAELEQRTYIYGTLHTLASGLQSLLAGFRRARAPKDNAIVILGFWRSGTTLLHELLCTDPRFGFPTTYACLNPQHFILTQKFALKRFRGQVRRPQDKMMIGLQTPQEDEFALLCLGARSPYEGLLAPAHLVQSFAVADPDDLPRREAARWRRAFDRFFRGVSLMNGGKPLVLKSPTHSYRVKTLRRMLPEARFILIVRNPYEVFESMLRSFRALTAKYGLEPGLPDEQVRELILSERLRFEAKLQTGIEGLPANRLAVLSYEDLIRDPAGMIETLYRQLELPNFEQNRARLAADIAQRRDYVQDAGRPDTAWERRVSERWSGLFAQYGYRAEDRAQ
jgi:hypothetical protein